MPSFSIPLSGLDANSQALSVIANNLANLNTTGYKASRPVFSDLFYQQVASSGTGNPAQVGVGGTIGSISMISTQGSIENSGVNTDVAIQGNGYFIVDKGGIRLYTRAGNFTLDENGTLMSGDGGQVLGFTATNGVISTSQTLSPLTIASGQSNPPNPTTLVDLSMNLDVDATQFQSTVSVHDSLGDTHLLTFQFTKTGPGAWDYDITIPAAEVGQTGAPVSVNAGQLTFDGTGQLTTPAGDISGINIPNLSNGADPIDFTWRLRDPGGSGLVTQVAAPSAVSNTYQDGFASGSLQSYTIRGDGIIEGIFTNGQTMSIGQLATATFPNVQGLLRNGSNNFLATLSSGAPSIGEPGTGGRGAVAGGAIENSNVDIAREFAQLIIAQRGFQANSRAITTFDEVTQEAINLKR